MPLFSIKAKKLQMVKEVDFGLERDIQTLTEENLEAVFNLKFIKSEFSLNNLRIDTLAYDERSKSFVIIEFKNDRSFSVIDQGFAYLSLMLNNKAEFILEYNQCGNKNIKKEDIDWTQSKVIFVSPQFSKYQQQAINFRDLPIELWQVSKYTSDLVQYLKLETPDSSESIKTISKKSKVVEEVSREVKVYTEEDHLERVGDSIREIYNKIKQEILSVDDKIIFNPQKYYVSLRKDRNFAFISFSKSKMKIVIMLPYEKGEQMVKYNKISPLSDGVQRFYNGHCFEVQVEEGSNLPEILELIKMSKEV